jgi:hypothetical protein
VPTESKGAVVTMNQSARDTEQISPPDALTIGHSFGNWSDS